MADELDYNVRRGV